MWWKRPGRLEPESFEYRVFWTYFLLSSRSEDVKSHPGFSLASRALMVLSVKKEVVCPYEVGLADRVSGQRVVRCGELSSR